jgi:hypothetical protein
MGEGLIWVAFLKITEVAKIMWYFIPVMFYLDQIMVGLPFGCFLNRPCITANYTFNEKKWFAGKQGDQMSLIQNHPKSSPTHVLSQLMQWNKVTRKNGNLQVISQSK